LICTSGASFLVAGPEDAALGKAAEDLAVGLARHRLDFGIGLVREAQPQVGAHHFAARVRDHEQNAAQRLAEAGHERIGSLPSTVSRPMPSQVKIRLIECCCCVAGTGGLCGGDGPAAIPRRWMLVAVIPPQVLGRVDSDQVFDSRIDHGRRRSGILGQHAAIAQDAQVAAIARALRQAFGIDHHHGAFVNCCSRCTSVIE
jgi:hypothetical protein